MRTDRPALGADLERPQFQFAKPLSDPSGGTAASDGRYPVKMTEPEAAPEAPEEVLSFIGGGALQLMDAYLRLYGHPHLLAVAEQINGPDFVPWNEGIFVKQPGLGPSTAWHQDGTTHWDGDHPDAGTHGFNLMTQLYPTTAANALWVVPGTHRGRFDIAAHVAATGGSDRLPGAVPMLCNPGDVAINNRQVVHGAFANQSEGLRVTLVFGFHRRSSLLGVVRGDPPVTYDAVAHPRALAHRRAGHRRAPAALSARAQLPLPAPGRRTGRQPLDRGRPRLDPQELRHQHHVHLSGRSGAGFETPTAGGPLPTSLISPRVLPGPDEAECHRVSSEPCSAPERDHEKSPRGDTPRTAARQPLATCGTEGPIGW